MSEPRDPRLDERHGCPDCPPDEWLQVTEIVYGPDDDEGALLVVCSKHGGLMHWSREKDFCWCEK